MLHPKWESAFTGEILDLLGAEEIAKNARRAPTESTVHGRAQWADIAHDFSGLIVVQPQDLKDGIFLGFGARPNPTPANKWQSKNIEIPLAYRGEAHGLTMAPTRCGKGATSIIPTLLTNDESTFVLDLKGENWFCTSPARIEHGHKVLCINPFNQFADELGHSKPMTCRFNPLHKIKKDSPTFDEDIAGIAEAIIVHDKENAHFTERARDLLSVIIGFVCTDPDELAKGNNTLMRVRQILKFNEDRFSALMQLCAQSDIPLVANGESFTKKDSKEIEGVKSTVNTQTSFIDAANIAYFLSGHDFDFSDLRKSKVTIYCIMPLGAMVRYFRFARLMVQSLFNELFIFPSFGDRRVLVILDEQRQLEGMTILEKCPSLLAGYGVRLWSIFQSYPQMLALYGQHTAQEFISNAGFIQMIGVNDRVTSDEIGNLLGSETIRQQTKGRSEKDWFDAPLGHFPDPMQPSQISEGEQFIKSPFLTLQDWKCRPPNRGLLVLNDNTLTQGQDGDNPSCLDFPVMTWARRYFDQSPEQTFLGSPYAPHPLYSPDAFEQMRNFQARFNNVSPNP
jgi:hypothetical protein